MIFSNQIIANVIIFANNVTYAYLPLVMELVRYIPF
jgi:hypothetical protein